LIDLSKEQWLHVGQNYHISDHGRVCSKMPKGWYYWIPTRNGHYTSWKRNVQKRGLDTIATSSIRRMVEHHWGQPPVEITRAHIAEIQEICQEANHAEGTSVYYKRRAGVSAPKRYIGGGVPILERTKRKCHTCGKATTHYWCDKCRPEMKGEEEWGHPDDWYGAWRY